METKVSSASQSITRNGQGSAVPREGVYLEDQKLPTLSLSCRTRMLELRSFQQCFWWPWGPAVLRSSGLGAGCGFTLPQWYWQERGHPRLCAASAASFGSFKYIWVFLCLSVAISKAGMRMLYPLSSSPWRDPSSRSSFQQFGAKTQSLSGAKWSPRAVSTAQQQWAWFSLQQSSCQPKKVLWVLPRSK